MIIEFIIMAIASMGVTTAIILALLTLAEVWDWFTARDRITERDADVLRVTVADHLASGNYRVVQGLYSKRTDSFVDSRTIEAEDLDSDLQDYHENDKVVVYQ